MSFNHCNSLLFVVLKCVGDVCIYLSQALACLISTLHLFFCRLPHNKARVVVLLQTDQSIPQDLTISFCIQLPLYLLLTNFPSTRCCHNHASWWRCVCVMCTVWCRPNTLHEFQTRFLYELFFQQWLEQQWLQVFAFLPYSLNWWRHRAAAVICTLSPTCVLILPDRLWGQSALGIFKQLFSNSAMHRPSLHTHHLHSGDLHFSNSNSAGINQLELCFCFLNM